MSIASGRLVLSRSGWLMGIAVAALMIALLAGSGWILLVRDAPSATIGGPFRLQDGAGRMVTDRDLRGSWLLVYFGYTNCPDVCPTTLNDVSAALDKLGKRAERVRPVFITVDPARDTPAVMRDYATNFGPRLLALTGSASEIAEVAREYRVYYAEHRTGPAPGDYTMDHSSLLYLMGPDGAFVAPIRADDTAEAIADEIGRHIS